jgi:hypothetical protein
MTGRIVMSALPPKADIGGVSSDVRFVPKADILRCNNFPLFGHLVGEAKLSGSSCLHTKRPKFFATRFAKVAKNVDGILVDHLAQLKKRLVWLQINIQNLLSNLLGAKNNNPLPKNTVAKNLSSRAPRRSRSTPMNHRNAIPANGTRLTARATELDSDLSHDPGSCGSSGTESLNSQKTRIKMMEKSIPAIAAAL